MYHHCFVYIYELNGYIYIYNETVYISSSSCRAVGTDIPDPLSPFLPIVHRLRQVFRATPCILTLPLDICSCWSSCFCPAICGGPLEYITYELVPASPTVTCMSGLSNLDSFRDGRQVAVQLVPCGMLPPGLVQYCSQHSCVIAVQLLLQPFSQRPSSASIQQYRYDRFLEETAFTFHITLISLRGLWIQFFSLQQ